MGYTCTLLVFETMEPTAYTADVNVCYLASQGSSKLSHKPVVFLGQALELDCLPYVQKQEGHGNQDTTHACTIKPVCVSTCQQICAVYSCKQTRVE